MREVLLSILVLTALAPATAAQTAPPCSDVTDDGATALGPAYLREAGDQVEVWQETNDVDGLQTAECETSGGGTADADTRHAQLPADALALAGEALALVGQVVGLLFDGAELVLAIAEAICSLVLGMCNLA